MSQSRRQRLSAGPADLAGSELDELDDKEEDEGDVGQGPGEKDYQRCRVSDDEVVYIGETERIDSFVIHRLKRSGSTRLPRPCPTRRPRIARSTRQLFRPVAVIVIGGFEAEDGGVSLDQAALLVVIISGTADSFVRQINVNEVLAVRERQAADALAVAKSKADKYRARARRKKGDYKRYKARCKALERELQREKREAGRWFSKLMQAEAEVHDLRVNQGLVDDDSDMDQMTLVTTESSAERAFGTNSQAFGTVTTTPATPHPSRPAFGNSADVSPAPTSVAAAARTPPDDRIVPAASRATTVTKRHTAAVQQHRPAFTAQHPTLMLIWVRHNCRSATWIRTKNPRVGIMSHAQIETAYAEKAGLQEQVESGRVMARISPLPHLIKYSLASHELAQALGRGTVARRSHPDAREEETLVRLALRMRRVRENMANVLNIRMKQHAAARFRAAWPASPEDTM